LRCCWSLFVCTGAVQCRPSTLSMQRCAVVGPCLCAQVLSNAGQVHSACSVALLLVPVCVYRCCPMQARPMQLQVTRAMRMQSTAPPWQQHHWGLALMMSCSCQQVRSHSHSNSVGVGVVRSSTVRCCSAVAAWCGVVCKMQYASGGMLALNSSCSTRAF
jgi:hypothetical protein